MKPTIRLAPLTGKYYGTVVTIKARGLGTYHLKIWIPDEGKANPSNRQIKDWGCRSRTAWRKREPIRGPGNEVHDCDWPCDSHYETTDSYLVARMIVKALRIAVKGEYQMSESLEHDRSLALLALRAAGRPRIASTILREIATTLSDGIEAAIRFAAIQKEEPRA